MKTIKNHTFGGTSMVFNGFLSGAIQDIVRFQAATLIHTAANLAEGALEPLTNNAGGTADGSFAPVPLPANAELGTNDAAQKASTEAAFGTVRDAISELIAKANEIAEIVPAIPQLTDSTGGTAADGTVGAITVNLSGVGTSMASAEGIRNVARAHVKALAQVAHFVNRLASAAGVDGVNVSGSGFMLKDFSETIAAVSTDTGDTATTGSIAKVADVNATLIGLRDHVTELATVLNNIVEVEPELKVFAG